MKHIAFMVILIPLCGMIVGCATAWNAYDDRGAPPDTLRAMTMQDVIALSQAKVADDVIISQIRASGTYFTLSTQDIIDLTNAGVSKAVIQAMIKTGEVSGRESGGRYYYYPPYYSPWYFWADYPFYYYPWYPAFSIGLGFGNYYPSHSYRYFAPSYTRHFGSYGGRGAIRRR